MESIKQMSPGELKIREYVDRIKNGESKQSIYEELSPVFVDAIEQELRPPKEKEDMFSTFTMKYGETDTGMFWYEYRNEMAKALKETGDFEWGKERLYFDVAPSDFESVRDMAMLIAQEEQIPLGFKYLDIQNSFPSAQDGTETRFVMNFVSADDAMRFYRALKNHPEYKSIQHDREIGYGGIRVDNKIEYANGFREQRAALVRIMEGAQNATGEWEWTSESGRAMRIPMQEYAVFKKQFDTLQDKMRDTELLWEAVRESFE